MSPYRYISFSEQPGDFQLRQSATTAGRQLELMDRNNQLIWSASLTTADTVAAADQPQLIRGIRNALQVKYLRTLPDGGELAQLVKAEILSGENIQSANGLVFTEGDRYSLKLVNNSDHKLFFTVLDIYPDNKVEVLYPYKGKEPADYSIEKKIL